jgi:hypothetical protein
MLLTTRMATALLILCGDFEHSRLAKQPELLCGLPERVPRSHRFVSALRWLRAEPYEEFICA